MFFFTKWQIKRNCRFHANPRIIDIPPWHCAASDHKHVIKKGNVCFVRFFYLQDITSHENRKAVKSTTNIHCTRKNKQEIKHNQVKQNPSLVKVNEDRNFVTISSVTWNHFSLLLFVTMVTSTAWKTATIKKMSRAPLNTSNHESF